MGKLLVSRLSAVLAGVAALAVFLVGIGLAQTFSLTRPVLTATRGDSTIQLEWEEVDGAASYDLWAWDCVNLWVRLSESARSPHVHQDPVDRRRYRYTVRARNGDEYSDWARRVSQTVNPITTPRFRVASGHDYVRLTVLEVENAAGYEVKTWWPGAGDTWIRLPEPNADDRSLTHADLQPGVTYYYVVRAYTDDKCGYSDWTEYFSYTTPPGLTPAAPTPTTAPTPTPGSTPTDEPASVPGGGGATEGGPVLRPDPTATPTATITSTPTPRPRPGRIDLTHADSTHNSITVYWSVPDPPALEYILRAGRDRNVKEVIYGGNATSFTWTGLEANTTYYFSAFGSNGPAFSDNGPFSYVLTKATKVQPNDVGDYVPGAPTGLIADNDLDGVRLSWSASTRSHPGDCNCPLTEQRIFRRYHSASGLPYRFHHIGTTFTRTWYLDKSARDDVTYVYHVKAVNKHGASDPSNDVRIEYFPPEPTPTPEPDLPAAPSGLSLSIAGETATLSWNDPDDSGITSYQVLRRHATGATSAFSVIADQAVSGFSVDASGKYTYADSAVEACNTYIYRVRARNADGLGPQSGSVRADISCPLPGKPAQPTSSGTYGTEEHHTETRRTLTWAQTTPAAATFELEFKWKQYSNWQKVYAGVETSYTHGRLNYREDYDYRVRGLNPLGDPGPWSDTLRVVLPDCGCDRHPNAGCQCECACDLECNGSYNDCLFCGPGPSVPALEFTAHYRLHLMMRERVLAAMRAHPYHTLHNR